MEEISGYKKTKSFSEQNVHIQRKRVLEVTGHNKPAETGIPPGYHPSVQ